MAEAERYNEGKPEMSYILDFPRAVEALVRVKEYGARKYTRDNWKAGNKPDREYFDSLFRHLFAGNSSPFDPESGCLHAAHAIWNLMVWIELNYEGELYDPELDITVQSATPSVDSEEMDSEVHRDKALPFYGKGMSFPAAIDDASTPQG